MTAQMLFFDFFFFSEKDTHLNAVEMLHIFEIPSFSNEKPSISIEIPSISIEILGILIRKL